MGPIGVQEMIAIFVIALLLFGPKKLPELGRLLGKGLSEFRRAKNELKTTFETHLRELEKETQTEARPTTTGTDYSPAPYQHPYDDYNRYDTQSGSLSDPHDGYSPHEAAISEPSTASATATQDAEAHRDYSSQSSPVAGTIPRGNGVQPAEPVPVATEEQHPA